MAYYKILIELKSDLCVSDGGVYNSMIDMDICQDVHGFPYIPAKRLRGCLRECAEELNDWSDTSEHIDIAGLFGDKGKYDNKAKVRIGNAYLENYDDNKKIVWKLSDLKLMHPQNVLGLYTSVRTQTRIDYETGVAVPTTLRTMRVANKGLKFISEVEILESDIQKAEEYRKAMEDCCTMLRHMGISRTRGLGEVKVLLLEDRDKDFSACAKDEDCPLSSDIRYKLDYEISLLEPMICKAVNGGESNSLDYIEGSKVLGIIVQGLPEKNSFMDFVNEDKPMIFSNAYITKDHIRYTEVPGYIYGIKNEKKCFVNKLYETDEIKRITKTEDKQLNQMKHAYVQIQDGSLQKMDVEMEERNHHRRPEDKSIGRALSSESDADFYQISSISEGQVFAGYVIGNGDQIAAVKDVLARNAETFMGYSKMSEYGKVRISIENVKEISSGDAENGSEEISVTLVSPAIIYNDNAMPSSNPVDLREEVLKMLEMKNGWKEKAEIVETRQYIRYTSLGGYNVTWNMRKPTVPAFDKGTTIYFRFGRSLPLNTRDVFHIGERTLEGYGEMVVRKENACNPSEKDYLGKVIDTEKMTDNQPKVDVGKNEFLNKLCGKLLSDHLRSKAIQEAQNGKSNEDWRATVSNMLLLARDCQNLSEVDAGMKARYEGKSEKKEKKLKIANNIIENVKQNAVVDKVFLEKYGVEGFHCDKDRLQMEYLRDCLTNLKYAIREKVTKGAQDGE